MKPDTVSVSEDLSELQKFGHSVNVTINEVRNEQSENDAKSKVGLEFRMEKFLESFRFSKVNDFVCRSFC